MSTPKQFDLESKNYLANFSATFNLQENFLMFCIKIRNKRIRKKKEEAVDYAFSIRNQFSPRSRTHKQAINYFFLRIDGELFKQQHLIVENVSAIYAGL